MFVVSESISVSENDSTSTGGSLTWEDVAGKDERSNSTLSMSAWQLLDSLGSKSLSTTICRNAARNSCGLGLSPCPRLLRITENMFSKQSWLSLFVSKNLKSWFMLRSAQSESKLWIEIFHPFKHGSALPLVNFTLSMNFIASFKNCTCPLPFWMAWRNFWLHFRELLLKTLNNWSKDSMKEAVCFASASKWPSIHNVDIPAATEWLKI